jgi:hypothetical protein
LVHRLALVDYVHRDPYQRKRRSHGAPLIAPRAT